VTDSTFEERKDITDSIIAVNVKLKECAALKEEGIEGFIVYGKTKKVDIPANILTTDLIRWFEQTSQKWIDEKYARLEELLTQNITKKDTT
jgi:hypothetical protein